jgi:uncharacterized protein YbaR (Trm112 family)
MELSSSLLKILVCPATGGKLIYDRQNKELISESIGLAYPIIDGIPIMLVDKARKISNIKFAFNDKISSELEKTENSEHTNVA